MKTLQQYLTEEFERSGAIDHMLRVNVYEGKVTFYIHAYGKDSNTVDFQVDGNTLTTVLQATLA